MDVYDYSVEVVLNESRRFMVPIYQRKYQWTDARLELFWEDVSIKAAEVLDNETRFQHYMGALILSPVDQGSPIARTPVVEIVDGQQRLTTFQIFLASLREVARTHGLKDLIGHVEGYLFNEPKTRDTDPLTRFKLTPTPSDREIFHDIIKLSFEDVARNHSNLFWGGRVPKNTQFPALRTYFLFCSWMKDFALAGPEDIAEMNFKAETAIDLEENGIDIGLVETRLIALLQAVLDRLKLVVITLGDGDDAQVIFETLNSRGEPLLAMDLVRNNIFHRADKQNVPVEALYKRYWNSLDDGWWREPAPNARPRRPRLDHFLAHVLTAETGNKVSVRELYAEYRAFAISGGMPCFEEVEQELKLLERYAPLYETLEDHAESDAALQWLGRKLTSWQVTTAYPVAMQIGLAKIDDAERHFLARLIYSFIARRAICGLTTKNLNNVFQSMASEFLTSGVSVQTLKNFFHQREGASSRFPSNDELHQGVITERVYDSIAPRTRLVDILWELERASRSKLAENIQLPADLWIEHVLPQTWTNDWPFEDEEHHDSPDDQIVMRREGLIHTLGNLTLLTGVLNISSGNASFAVKKEKFAEHSGLFLNKWFETKDRWTEIEILERGERFAHLARAIWVDIRTVG